MRSKRRWWQRRFGVAMPLGPRRRISVALYLRGGPTLHFKVRWVDVWFHFVIKLRRESALGRDRSRYAIWLGAFRSERGVKSGVYGLKFAVSVMAGTKVTRSMDVPIIQSRQRHERKAA